MTTQRVAKPTRRSAEVPPLYNGDRLTQAEFHRRYEAMPEDVKAELVEGVVYMASPLSEDHGEFHLHLGTAINLYRILTPGVVASDNATTILGPKAEPQPDLVLHYADGYGGQAFRGTSLYINGPPELVVEIAHSSEAIDLGAKKRDYQRHGVCEYLVYCTRDASVHWFHFPSRKKLRPDRDGVWRSKIFPGLWIDGHALATHDGVKFVATVQAGLATPEHVAFVAELARRRKRK